MNLISISTFLGELFAKAIYLIDSFSSIICIFDLILAFN